MELSLIPYIMDEPPYTPAVRWANAGSLLSPSPTSESRTPPPFFWPKKHVQRLVSQVSQVDKNSTINHDEGFEVRIDVTHFTPEEISVQLNEENSVSVEGKHDEKKDDHGIISRHFVRKFTIPEDCDIKKIECKLSSDNVLILSAPKKIVNKQVSFREIPIQKVGAATHKEEDQKK